MHLKLPAGSYRKEKIIINFTAQFIILKENIISIIQNSIATKHAILQDENMLDKIALCVTAITEAFKKGNKVLFCGNGGSAADAQHLAAEFTGRFYKNREALPAEALHVNGSYLTAVANDYGFETVYARMVAGTGRKGDILVALSTSGNSANITNAAIAAQQKDMTVIGFTGHTGGELKAYCTHLINVPATDTPRIQESHIMIGHIICQLVEQLYFS